MSQTTPRDSGIIDETDGGEGGMMNGWSLTGYDTPTVVRGAAILIGLAALYSIAGKFGLTLAVSHPNATPVWPPSGIALAAFLLIGYWVWPAVFLAACLVNVTTAGSLTSSIGIATGNTMEGLLGAYLVNRFANGRLVFGRQRDTFLFVLLAAGFSTTVSATTGVTSLSLTGYADWQRFSEIWLTWWLGDATGALIVTPVIVLWTSHPTSPGVAASFSKSAHCLRSCAWWHPSSFRADGR